MTHFIIHNEVELKTKTYVLPFKCLTLITDIIVIFEELMIPNVSNR